MAPPLGWRRDEATDPTMPSTNYSILSVLREALRGHTGWGPAWRDAEPKADYDVIIVGGGGHGLATAYYLARRHGPLRIAVLEKGWIGGGNVGRNTTIVRSNYLLPGNIPFYEYVDEALGRAGAGPQLQRHGEPARRAQPLSTPTAQRDAYARRGNAMRLHGVDAELLDHGGGPDDAAVPRFRQRALPDPGRPAAARAAARCATTRSPGATRAPPTASASTSSRTARSRASRREGGRVVGVETSRGVIGAKKVGVAVAGQLVARRRHGRPAPADREPRAAGVRDRRR